MMPDDKNRPSKKQAFYVIAPIKVHRQLHDFGDRETRALHVAAATIDAIGAVVNAKIGQQDFQQRNTAPVRRIRMADSHAFVRADTASFQ
jgi:hypothetical protein